MRRRFFWSMVAVSAITIALLVVVAALAGQRAQRAATERTLSAAVDAVAQEIESLQEETTELRTLADGTAIRRILEQARRSTDSEIGLVLRSPRARRVITPFIDDLGVDLDVGPGQQQIDRSARGTVVVRSVPLTEFPDSDVVVVAARSTPVVDWGPQVRLILIGVVVAAGVAAIAARSLSGWVARRIAPLSDGARALSEGDLSARVPEDGDDEVSSVSASFNQMAEALEGSRERERRFLLAVGHDLRTPLTTITGYAEALEEGVDDPDEIRRIASVLTTENRRLGRLIEDVTLLARLDSAEFGVRPEAVDVAAHVRGVVGGYEARARSARVALAASVEDVGIRSVDPDRVGQLLGNLIENALRFTPETGRIDVGLGAEAGDVVLSVADTGPGIEAEDLPHIFERFYVARRYRGVRPEGSGLGLSIVERIATTMGGAVTAASEPGRGTTFTVRLPAPPIR